MKLLLWIFGAGITLAITIIGGVIRFQNEDHKVTKAKLDDLRKDHSKFQVEVANKYVSHDHLQKLEDRMDKRFDELKAILQAVLQNEKG